jgi:hypothetical protein
MPISVVRWLALMSLLGGCACCCGNWAPIGPSPDIEPPDIVGTWVSDEGARLTLDADLTFTAESLHACDDGGSPGDGPDSGSGTWQLGDPHTLDPYQDLELSYAPYGEHLQSWRAQEDEIVYLHGDTDNGEICFFERT